jgi:hypothetical protein
VDDDRRIIVGATFTGPEVQDFLHAATIAVVVPGSTTHAGGRRARAYSAPADRHPEPVYEEARRVARLRSDDLDR